MLAAVAVVPQTPLLVPEIASGAADELADVRAAAIEAVRGVCADAERVVVVVPGVRDAAYDDVAVDLAGLGYEGVVSTRSGFRRASSLNPSRSTSGGASLPLGAWLLDAADVTLPRTFHETTGTALDLRDPRRTALVVLADGTAKRTEAAPGYFDPRALAYDAVVATALASGDAETLAQVDPALGAELWARGIPALHALAATVCASDAAATEVKMLAEAAPYGVAYWVATWRF